MKISVTFPVLILHVVSAIFITGCINKPAKVEKKPENISVDQVIKDAPDWVNRGSRYSSVQDARFFYGVASSASMGDLAQQKALADDGARAKVTLLLSYYLHAFYRFHQNALEAKLVKEPTGSIQPWINDVLKANMISVRIIGGWRDTKTNTVWSIAELDLNSVKSAMADLDRVEDDLKQVFDANAEKIFDRIGTEGQK